MFEGDEVRAKCKVEWCGRSSTAAGWCNAHYQRNRLGKDMDTPHPPQTKWGQRASVESGQRFGRLAVVRFERLAGRANAYLCQCDCGKTSVTTAQKLIAGKTHSCGCLARETSALVHLRHGHARHNGKTTSTYKVWSGMKARCLSPSDKSFSQYGGRGITVCERWLTFENFLADMGEHPAGMSIERKDNLGNYEPDNCKWATVTEQNRNKRTSVFIEHNGERRTISHWSEILGVPRSVLRYYIRAGLSIDYAFARCEEVRQRRERGERHRGKAFHDHSSAS